MADLVEGPHTLVSRQTKYLAVASSMTLAVDHITHHGNWNDCPMRASRCVSSKCRGVTRGNIKMTQ
jgi:hypothetical protein